MVIGGGLAGIRAAVESRRRGASVLLVSQSPMGKANNSAVSKGYFAVCRTGDYGDSPVRHLNDILEAGGGIGEPELVSEMVEGLEGEVAFLTECGVPLVRGEDGSPARTVVPGHSFPRVLGTRRGSGMDLLGPLAAKALDMGVRTEDGVALLSLLSDGERIYGAGGFTRRGEPALFRAGAVILASGGAGGIYRDTNNAPGTVGLGQAMALEAGLSLRDMEFVQFYPTYLRMPGKPRAMFFYETLVAVAGATLRNRYGQDIRELYGLEEGRLLTRDRLSRAIASEIRAGRGVGPDGEAVAADLTTMAGGDKFRRFLPRFIPSYADRLEVAPVTHFTMGGVAVKSGGETGIAGLWAIGEVSGGIHGANRIGGNALSECLVLGRAAGAAAAEYSMGAGKRGVCQAGPGTDLGSGRYFEDLSWLEAKLKRVMTIHAGILRDAAGLGEGLAELNRLNEALAGRESLYARRAGMMLDVARAICLSALYRKESRGSHHRLDHPGERDGFQGSFMVKKSEREFKVEFKQSF